MDQFYFDKISKECLITTYLEERNIFPSKKHAERYVYKCPIHEGDNDPSFTVYLRGKDSDYQNYFCFGCHSGSSIINLVSAIEKITPYQAYLELLKRLDIHDDGRGQFHIASVQEFLRMSENSGIDNIRCSEILFMKINAVLKNYLELIGYEEEETNNIEKLYPIIDSAAMAADVRSLEKIFQFLVKGNSLSERFKKVREKKIKRISDNPWKI